MMNSPYENATPDQLDSPLVQEFLSIHDMFRQQLQAIVSHVDSLLSGDPQIGDALTQERIHAVIRTGAAYTQMLHDHHNREALFVFPVLQADGLDQDTLDQLNAEHDEISALVDQFAASIHNIAQIDPNVMQHDLRRLSDALRDHLAYEETHVCPFFAKWSAWPHMDF